MHTPEEQAWDRDDLFEEITLANVEDFRSDRQSRIIEVTIRDVDLPFEIPVGHVYVRGSSEQLREAIGEGLSAILGCMETGVPETRRAPLPPARLRRSISGALVAIARLVRGGPIP